MELRLACVTTGHIGITSGSSHKLGRYPSELNWGSLGVYWGLYTLQKGAQTKLCYEWQPMANEELW